MPIYLIRTDIYGKPADRADIELTEEAKKFWQDRKDPISGRIEQTRNALVKEINSYYETSNLGELMVKYLGKFVDKIQLMKEKSNNRDEFVKNLIGELGEENMARLKERIEDGD